MNVQIACCWDDGPATDIRMVEILRKHHAKATFNLCPARFVQQTIYPHRVPFQANDLTSWERQCYPGQMGLEMLRETYQDFQVASHCYSHERADQLSAEEFTAAAMKAQDYLENFFQRECRGFAWPYGAAPEETARCLQNAGFIYGRTTGESIQVEAFEDPLRLQPSCHFKAPHFWEKFNAVKKRGGVFYFWGHSYELRDYEPDWRYFDDVIHALSNDPDAHWIDVKDIVG